MLSMYILEESENIMVFYKAEWNKFQNTFLWIGRNANRMESERII